jgi:hypothetical protein
MTLVETSLTALSSFDRVTEAKRFDITYMQTPMMGGVQKKLSSPLMVGCALVSMIPLTVQGDDLPKVSVDDRSVFSLVGINGTGADNPLFKLEPYTNWSVLSEKQSGGAGVEWFEEILRLQKQSSKLFARLNEEFMRVTGNIVNSESKEFEVFRKVEMHLRNLPFNDCCVDYVEGDFFKVSMNFDESRLLIVTKSLESDGNEVTFSYFMNRKLLAASMMNVSELVRSLKTHFSA